MAMAVAVVPGVVDVLIYAEQASVVSFITAVTLRLWVYISLTFVGE